MRRGKNATASGQSDQVMVRGVHGAMVPWWEGHEGTIGSFFFLFLGMYLLLASHVRQGLSRLEARVGCPGLRAQGKGKRLKYSPVG